MKKLLYLVLVLSVLASCKKPPVPIKKSDSNTEDSGTVKVSPYVGNWSYQSITMSNGIIKVQGQNFGTFSGTGKDIVGSIKVTANPNRFHAEIAYTAALDITVFGQTQQQDFPIDNRTMEGSWTEQNGKIELIADDGTPITMISSSSTEIVFGGKFTQQVPVGQSFTADATSDVVFVVTK